MASKTSCALRLSSLTCDRLEERESSLSLDGRGENRFDLLAWHAAPSDGALPAAQGAPLSRWSATELAREAVARGIVEQDSGVTVWRWLSQDAIKPLLLSRPLPFRDDERAKAQESKRDRR